MFSIRKLGLAFGVLLSVAVIVHCGSNTTTTYTATKASGVISGVSIGIVGAGAGVGSTSLGAHAVAMLEPSILDLVMKTAFASGEGVDGRCDAHGYALQTGTTTKMNSSQPDYVSMNLFCKLAKNTFDPDTVQGTYAEVQSIACALERAGMVFDGVAHSIVMTIDSNCFTASQITGMGGAASMTVSVVAAQPAPFNSYYDAGAVITVPSFGIFKYAAKVTGSKIEFISGEDQSSITAGKTGAYGGSFDTSTGVLAFESRNDRFAALTAGSCGSSCGFGRHLRVAAKLAVDSSGKVTGLNTLSMALGNISRTDDSYNGMYGELLTASGDIATGIKTRFYSIIPSPAVQSSSSQFNLASAWTEASTPEGCYTTNSSVATTCGAGIVIGTGAVPFAMAAGYTTPLTWLAGLTTGINFSTVTLADVQ